MSKYTLYVYPSKNAKTSTQIIRDIESKKEANRLKKRFGSVPTAPTRHAKIRKC